MLSKIALNVNVLNFLIKCIEWLNGLIHFSRKDTHRLKVKGWWKNIQCKWKQKGGAAILTWDKIDFKLEVNYQKNWRKCKNVEIKQHTIEQPVGHQWNQREKFFKIQR